jgi:hypothetical protein
MDARTVQQQSQPAASPRVSQTQVSQEAVSDTPVSEMRRAILAAFGEVVLAARTLAENNIKRDFSRNNFRCSECWSTTGVENTARRLGHSYGCATGRVLSLVDALPISVLPTPQLKEVSETVAGGAAVEEPRAFTTKQLEEIHEIVERTLQLHGISTEVRRG